MTGSHNNSSLGLQWSKGSSKNFIDKSLRGSHAGQEPPDLVETVPGILQRLHDHAWDVRHLVNDLQHLPDVKQGSVMSNQGSPRADEDSSEVSECLPCHSNNLQYSD